MSMEYIFGCNILIDCVKCRKVYYEVDPVYRNTKIDIINDIVEESEVLDVTLPILDKFLKKEGWKRMFGGGYICNDCYKELKEINQKNISKELGFIK